MSSDTETVLQKHLAAARVGVDAIMQDYSDESVLVTEDTTYHGPDEIRGFFAALLAGLPEGIFDHVALHRCEVVDEWAYILWDAKPWVSLATDTFAIRNGKIRFQTFTANMGPQ